MAGFYHFLKHRAICLCILGKCSTPLNSQKLFVTLRKQTKWIESLMFMYCLRDTLGLDLQMHQTEQMSNKGYTEVTYILTTLFLVASG